MTLGNKSHQIPEFSRNITHRVPFSGGVPVGMSLLERLEIGLLSLMLALTMASQLRFQALGIGVGEVGIALWMTFAITRKVLWPGKMHSGPALGFICLLFLLWMVATFNGQLSNRTSTGALRDSVAYLGNLLLIACMYWRYYSAALARKFIGGVAVALAALNAVSVAAGKVGVAVTGIDLYAENTHRMNGLTSNPNQLALAAIIGIGSALAGSIHQNQHVDRYLRSFCLIISLIAGIYSDSDAFKSGCGAIVVFVGVRFVHMQGRETSRIKSVLGSALVVVAIAILLGLGFTPRINTKIVEVVSELYHGSDDHGSIRLVLWKNGIMALADSRLLGWGSGAYSGIFGPYEEMESHNSYIDFATNSGLGAAVLVVLLLLVLIYRGVRLGSSAIYPLIGLMPFMMFHHVYRHFLFSAIIALCSIVIVQTRALKNGGGCGPSRR